jgi:GNAT superfamily N-acetyltransferase
LKGHIREPGGIDVKSAIDIRAAKAGDEDLILALLHELAVDEKLAHAFKITRAVIARDYLGARPLIECDLAFEAGRAVGIATWYWTYGSFAAARGVYLEDLFVRPEFRGHGAGKALLAGLAKRALEGGAGRVEWAVLDWNKPSIDFYEGLGAKRSDGWFVYRLAGEALEDLADS